MHDVKIGGACLLLGLVVGQSSLLDRGDRQAPTSATANPLPAESDTGKLADSRLETQSSEKSQSPGGFDPVKLSRDSDDQAGNSVAWKETLASPVLELNEFPIAQSREVPATSLQPDLIVDPMVDQSSLAEPIASKNEESPKLPLQPKQTESSRSLIAKPSIGTSIESMIKLASRSSVMHPRNEAETCLNMESHGTAVKWADTPADAYRAADEQNKLVFLIHVSGNFEIPGFT